MLFISLSRMLNRHHIRTITNDNDNGVAAIGRNPILNKKENICHSNTILF
jgi:hypothetical protein